MKEILVEGACEGCNVAAYICGKIERGECLTKPELDLAEIFSMMAEQDRQHREKLRSTEWPTPLKVIFACSVIVFVYYTILAIIT